MRNSASSMFSSISQHHSSYSRANILLFITVFLLSGVLFILFTLPFPSNIPFSVQSLLTSNNIHQCNNNAHLHNNIHDQCNSYGLSGYWSIDGNWYPLHKNCVKDYKNLMKYLVGSSYPDPQNTTNLQDFTFLYNRVILLFGDSYERETVEFLCNVKFEEAHEKFKVINPIIEQLKGKYTFNAYNKYFNENWETKHYGFTRCDFQLYNITFLHFMHFGVTNSSSWLGNAPKTSIIWKHAIIPYTIQHFNKLPDIILAQSGLWDIVSKEDYKHYPNPDEIRQNWPIEMKQQIIEPIQQTYYNMSLSLPYIVTRTSAQVPDNNRRLNNKLITLANSLVYQFTEEYDIPLIDFSTMLIGYRDLIFDDHHYNPQVMFNLINVLLNMAKKHFITQSQI